MNHPLDNRAIGVVALVVLAVAVACTAFSEPLGTPEKTRGGAVPLIPYEIVAAYPHDAGASTQGLLHAGGALYESTGGRGRSSIRRVEPATGKVTAMHRLPPHLFGEGIAAVDDRLLQLTWKSRLGFVYDRASLRPVGSFRYATEGWGLTYDGRHLVLSDGSSYLRFHDPETFTVVRELQVRDPDGPVAHLNELEFARGAIYANVWKTHRIVKVSPETGAVLGEIDLSPIVNDLRLAGHRRVANGIAYDADRDRFYVTGKLWPKLFEIALLD